MGRTTAALSEQHQDLVHVVTTVSKLMTIEAIQGNPLGVVQALMKLSGKLSIHLAMEDKSLYPTLLQSGDPAVQATARRFVQEMGSLSTGFHAFIQKWTVVEKLKKEPESFIRETKQLFGLLGQRITREEAELYPLLA